jgi:hypothetical protein
MRRRLRGCMLGREERCMMGREEVPFGGLVNGYADREDFVCGRNEEELDRLGWARLFA